MRIWQLVKRILNRKIYYGRNKISHIGLNVTLPYDIRISGGQNISIGNSVHIGAGAVFMATNATIKIKHNVVASHNLKIITGDHERRVGTFCNLITEATKNHALGLDQPVVIESDVWIGMNVVILKGVTIGRGVTVSAGAVVHRSMPPYCICGGVPARVIKFYWTIEQILEHEKALYPVNERYTREQLEEIFVKYQKQNQICHMD